MYYMLHTSIAHHCWASSSILEKCVAIYWTHFTEYSPHSSQLGKVSEQVKQAHIPLIEKSVSGTSQTKRFLPIPRNPPWESPFLMFSSCCLPIEVSSQNYPIYFTFSKAREQHAWKSVSGVMTCLIC